MPGLQKGQVAEMEKMRTQKTIAEPTKAKERAVLRSNLLYKHYLPAGIKPCARMPVRSGFASRF